MEEVRFDFDQLFDEYYLFFYESLLTLERTEREVEVIWNLLDLRPGMRVLDVPCGHGRIANRLAQRGCQVVGVDATPQFLDVARREAETMGTPVDYVRGDMRDLRYRDEFDAAINWFTSFGYFNEAENRGVLRGMHRALRPGGGVLIELQNRDRVLEEFQPVTMMERDGHYLIDRPRYNAITGYIETERIIVKDGAVRRAHFVVRMFTYPELRDWLHQAGFTELRACDERGEVYSLSARRMVVAGRKA